VSAPKFKGFSQILHGFHNCLTEGVYLFQDLDTAPTFFTHDVLAFTSGKISTLQFTILTVLRRRPDWTTNIARAVIDIVAFNIAWQLAKRAVQP
jgi:hypothetical protein